MNYSGISKSAYSVATVLAATLCQTWFATTAITGAPAASIAWLVMAQMPAIASVNSGSLGPQAEIFTLVNQERIRQGLRPLTYSPMLSQAAEAHSRDLIFNNLRGHTGSDGSTVEIRAQRAGYPSPYVGENVLWASYDMPQATVFSGWMNSKGHRENILRPEYQELGVGMAVNTETGDRQYVQVFGAQISASSSPSQPTNPQPSPEPSLQTPVPLSIIRPGYYDPSYGQVLPLVSWPWPCANLPQTVASLNCGCPLNTIRHPTNGSCYVLKNTGTTCLKEAYQLDGTFKTFTIPCEQH
jgi:uncharacterized protein YkwD